MSKKRFSIVFILIFSLFFSSCGKKELPQPTLKFAFWGDVDNYAFAKKVAEIYERTNPSIKLKVISMPSSSNYHSKILTMLAGGTPPDVMLVTMNDFTEFAVKGVLLDLTDFESDPEFQKLSKDIWPELLKANKFKGVTYAMPVWTNSIGIFYNKDLFDKEKLEYPSNDWTWDDFLSMARRLTKDFDGDGRLDQYGCSRLYLHMSGWGLYHYIRANGGRLFNEDMTQCLIDSPEAIEAIRWCIDLGKKYKVCPSARIVKEEMGRQEAFLTGRVAMFQSGRWDVSYFKEKIKNFEWGVAPLPKGKVDFSCQIPVFFGICSKTKYPEACWDFLKFMIGAEGQKLICNSRSDVPVLMPMVKSPEYLNGFSRPEANNIFVESLKGAEMYPHFPGQGPWMSEITRKIDLVEIGELPLEEACKNIASEYKKIVQGQK